MRAGSLRCFKVYVPNEQEGDALMCWQTPSPYAPLTFIGTWGDSQIGTGVKDMAKDFFKGVTGGLKRAVKNKPLLDFPCGVKRGVKQALEKEVQGKFAKKLDDIFWE